MNKKSVLIASSMILNIALLILVYISVKWHVMPWVTFFKWHVMPWVAFLLIVDNIVLILCVAESCILRMKDDKNHQGKDGLSGKSNKKEKIALANSEEALNEITEAIKQNHEVDNGYIEIVKYYLNDIHYKLENSDKKYLRMELDHMLIRNCKWLETLLNYDSEEGQDDVNLFGKSIKTVISAPQLRAKIKEMAELRIRMDNESKPEKSEISQIKDDDEEGGPESSP